MIYIYTKEIGRGVHENHVTSFLNKSDFVNHAIEAMTFTGRSISKRWSISRICDELQDKFIGTFARIHCRVTRREAKKLLGQGANNHTWLS